MPKGSSKSWFCYMVRCRDGSLYVGITSDVEERINKHNAGAGPEFTAKRRPVELVWSEEFADSIAARRRETEVKAWRREKKLGLAATILTSAHAASTQGKGE